MECLWSYNSTRTDKKCTNFLNSAPPAGLRPALTNRGFGREVLSFPPRTHETAMNMLNNHCSVERDARGVVRFTICNAGSLNILGTAVINDVREGLDTLAKDPTIRV